MARLRRDSADFDPDVPIVVPPNGRFARRLGPTELECADADNSRTTCRLR